MCRGMKTRSRLTCVGSAEQDGEIGGELLFGDPLTASVEHRECRHRQPQQFLLHCDAQRLGLHARRQLMDLPFGEAGQNPLVKISLAEPLACSWKALSSASYRASMSSSSGWLASTRCRSTASAERGCGFRLA
jgi:hypothetical protein